MSNSTSAECPKTEAVDGPSFFQNGDAVFQAHHVGWIVASFFTIIAVVTSAWLICKHLQWYTNKREQRFIVRILLLVPVYAIVSLLSYFFWSHATPLLLVRDAYESTVLTAFFYLLLYYLSPDPTEQRAIFMAKGLSKEADAKARAAGEKLKTWVFPLGFIKWKPSDGLYFLQWMKWGVLQYCVIRPLTTLAAVALEYMGLYCEASWGPGWGHIYITVIVSISVTVAMYCLIQVYVCVSEDLQHQRPLLKLFAIKAVVFLTFWQASFLSVLTMFDVIKDSQYMTAEDINIGIGALLETFEMMLFGFLHVRAFTYKAYRPFNSPDSPDPPPKRTPMLRSFLHAMNFKETFREIWHGWKYMWAKMRGNEPKIDQEAKRLSHYQSAFGNSRPGLDGSKSAVMITHHTPLITVEKPEKISATLPAVHMDVAAEERVERQWLGLGDEFKYSAHNREKSDNLEVQIERELERRGYGSHIPGRGHIKMSPPSRDHPEYVHVPQRSWWRNVYNRISQSTQDADDEADHHGLGRQPSNRRRKSRSHRPSRGDDDMERRGLVDRNQRYEFDDPPPPSLIRQSRGQHQLPNDYHQNEFGIVPQHDMLSPLNVYADHQSSHVQRQQYRNPASPPPSRPSSRQHRSSREVGPERQRSRQREPDRHMSPPPPSHPDYFQHAPPLVHMSHSADSLFGRVFPPSTDHGTSVGHGQSTVPTHVSHGAYDIGHAGERNTRNAQVDMESAHGVPVEIVQGEDGQEMTGTQRSHKRDSAFHRPELHVDTAAEGAPAPVARPSEPAQPQQQHPVDPPPRRSQALRRNSAQVYSAEDVARRRQSRHNSAPFPLRMPQPLAQSPHTYYPQPPPQPQNRYQEYRATPPTPYSPTHQHQQYRANARYPPPGTGYASDNLDSAISQPSFSGTLNNGGKYPHDPYASSSTDNLSRYPGLPSPRHSDGRDRNRSPQPQPSPYDNRRRP